MAAKPIYLLAGGRGELTGGRRSALAKAVSAVGKAKPSLGYVGAASGDSSPFRLLISGFLKAAGAGEVLPLKLCAKKPDIRGAKAILDGCDAVFVTGGDVEAGMRVLRDTEVSAYLQTLAAQGKPFIGISAGSIMLALSWIRWRDPQDDSSAEVFPCLGLAPVYCDTHDEGSGWSELKALLDILPEGAEGWGIPAGGALVVGDGPVRWIGPAPSRFHRSAHGILSVMVEG